MMVDTLSWYLITAMSAAYAILDSHIKKVYEYLKQTLQSVDSTKYSAYRLSMLT